MRRNAERILNLINQMMDLRKIDKGMMQLHTQQTDLIKFVYDIHSLFGGILAGLGKILFPCQLIALPEQDVKSFTAYMNVTCRCFE